MEVIGCVGYSREEALARRQSEASRRVVVMIVQSVDVKDG